MTNKMISPLGMANNPQAAAQLVDRTFNEGRRDQYKRELTTNAMQAGARNVLATAVRLPDEFDDDGIKAAFVDDGRGMAPTKIRDYIGELFAGASTLGQDGNFQMGARVSTLPWNPDGVLVASWTDGDPDGALLHLRWDPDTHAYGVDPQLVEGHWVEVGTPPPWMRHPVIAEAGHGTVVVLLGSGPGCHTVGELGRDTATGEFRYPDRRIAETDWHYYNAKYWTLPAGVTLRTMWGRQELADWSALMGPGEYFRPVHDMDGQTAQYRTVDGVDKRIAARAVGDGGYRGTVSVTSPHGYGATVHWALFPQTSNVRADGTSTGNEVRSAGIALGLFGERHRDEVYNVHSGGHATTMMSYYGIARRELRERMVIIVEPDPASDQFIGAHPSGARDRLRIANADLPHQHWGEAFADQMPEPVRQRLRELNGEADTDQSDRHKRLFDRVREFLGRPVKQSPAGTERGSENDQPGGAGARRGGSRNPSRGPGSGGRSGRRGFGDRRNPTGEPARPLNQRPPREITVSWDAADEFVDTPGLLARWNAATRTLLLNPDHGVVSALIDGEQAGRRRDKHEEIAAIVRQAIADHLVGSIFATELYSRSALTRGQMFGESFAQDAVRDEMLTAMCLNVPTMERIVRQQFQGRIGFKRTVGPAGEAA